MSNLMDELHRQVLFDHASRPRNARAIVGATAWAEGHNKSCGDHITLCLKIEERTICDIGFQGSGCSISTSSASMMTDAVMGKTVVEASALFDLFHAMLTATPKPAIDEEQLGKLAAFQNVRKFPIRVKCATLPWHTLKRALAGSEKPPGGA